MSNVRNLRMELRRNMNLMDAEILMRDSLHSTLVIDRVDFYIDRHWGNSAGAVMLETQKRYEPLYEFLCTANPDETIRISFEIAEATLKYIKESN